MPAVAVGEHPADACPSRDRLREPGDADLALAAGEAADAGDVGARVDDRAAAPCWLETRDRAAAVGLGVGERGRERGGVAAEHAAAGRRRRRGPPGAGAPPGGGGEARRGRRRAAAARPPPPGRRTRARAGRRPGTSRSSRGRASGGPGRRRGEQAGQGDAERDHPHPRARRPRPCAATAAMPATTSSGAPSRARRGVVEHDELDDAAEQRPRPARATRVERSPRRTWPTPPPTSAAVNGASSET